MGIMICRWANPALGKDTIAWADIESPHFTPSHALSNFLAYGERMEILETNYHTTGYYDTRMRCAYWRDTLKEQTNGI